MLAIIDTSAILGTFSILHIPSERTTAGMIARAAFSKYVLMFDMLAGRLELFPLLILFHPSALKDMVKKSNNY